MLKKLLFNLSIHMNRQKLKSHTKNYTDNKTPYNIKLISYFSRDEISNEKDEITVNYKGTNVQLHKSSEVNVIDDDFPFLYKRDDLSNDMSIFAFEIESDNNDMIKRILRDLITVTHMDNLHNMNHIKESNKIIISLTGRAISSLYKIHESILKITNTEFETLDVYKRLSDIYNMYSNTNMYIGREYEDQIVKIIKFVVQPVDVLKQDNPSYKYSMYRFIFNQDDIYQNEDLIEFIYLMSSRSFSYDMKYNQYGVITLDILISDQYVNRLNLNNDNMYKKIIKN